MAFTFNENRRNMFLVICSSKKESEMVQIGSGKRIVVPQRLPEGFICHPVVPGTRNGVNNNGVQYMYDICCTSFIPQKINIPPSFEGYAIYICTCEVKQNARNPDSVFLETPDKFLIYGVLQTPGAPVTMKQYISEKFGKEKVVGVWVTPIRNPSMNGFNWVVVPTSIIPERIFGYSLLYPKMVNMFSPPENALGVVLSVGKIGVHGYLVNCPMHFQLGSTRLCEYRKIEITGYLTVVLVKSMPITLPKKYIQTYVTPLGSVLIRTIVSRPRIGPWYGSGASNKPTEPLYNFFWHPWFGKIIFSTKLVWSAASLMVLMSPTMNYGHTIKSFSSKTGATANRQAGGTILNLHYHLLGFHDKGRYWRIPDVPRGFFDSINFLIQGGVPLWGSHDTSNITNPDQSLKTVENLPGLSLNAPNDENFEPSTREQNLELHKPSASSTGEKSLALLEPSTSSREPPPKDVSQQDSVSHLLHPPLPLEKPLKIEGRYLRFEFIKHADPKVEDNISGIKPEDNFVSLGFHQNKKNT